MSFLTAAAHPGPSATSAQRPPPGSCGAQSASMHVAASIGRARDDGHRTGRPRNAPRNRLPHARDAPTAHAALPPAHQRQGRGWVLHIENHPRYKRSGAEQLDHDEPRETETGGRRFAVTVAGLGFGFHLSSPFKRLSPHSASRGLREPKTVHLVCPSHPWKPLVCSLAASDVDAESGRRSIEADHWRGDAAHAEP
jgi:hypothetical protein